MADDNPGGIEFAAAGSESLIGMAMLGKTAAALGLIFAILFIGATLVRRWGGRYHRQAQHVAVVGSTAVGAKERVVVVQVEDTWLVLGVGGGQVSRLHE